MIGAALLAVAAGRAFAEPLLEPIYESDVMINADHATIVRDGATTLLHLRGDVAVEVGAFRFRDQDAVVRITRRPGPGQAVRDFAFVFEQADTEGDGAVRADGKGLLVTLASRGRVLFELKAEAPTRAQGLPDGKLTRYAQARFEDYDRRLAKVLRPVPEGVDLTPAQLSLRERRRAQIRAQRPEVTIPDAPPEVARADDELIDRPVLPTRGTLRYGSVDRIVYQRGEAEDAVILIGGVRVMYEDADEGRDVLLTAERIVIFLDKDDNDNATTGRVDAGRVRGVYLEDGAVVSDGETTVRAPRAFYDLKTDRAVLLDAVVYRYDVRQRVPLYLRADLIRQTSADSFAAEDAVFTTSEFGKPHLSLGASRISLQQLREDDGSTQSVVSAQGLTVNVGQTPIFYWPEATVTGGTIPLRRVRSGFDGGNGAEVQTTWDLFALAGSPKPEGVELLGDIDLRGEHGLALGVDLDYEQGVGSGKIDGYFLPDDNGSDEIADRNDVDFDSETRGFIRAQHRQRLPAGWELWLEANHVSDPTLLEEFFPELAYSERAFETSAYFKQAQDDWSLTALIRGETNTFTPQVSPLLTPGYTVDKLPEAEYRLMTGVFDDAATFYHESRVGQMRLVFGRDSPAERGLTAAQSQAAFGIGPNTSFKQAALAAGVPTALVSRVDSRNELALPLRAGVFDVTPFAVGRVTAYDDDFAAFNGGNNDQARLWGGLGVRSSTQLSKTSNSFNNRLLDVQGVRHIIEPGVTLAAYDGTMNATDLPVYDPEVERLTEGGVARFGVLNTWQTKRGGPGRTRTVDWVTWRNDVVLVTEDSANPAALGRYYDARPEYTLGDDHFYSELLWAVTEATAFTGALTHNFDSASVEQWRAGFENRHSDRLTTAAHYREIDALDARLLSYGAQLQLTSKYQVGLYQVIDFGEGDSRTVQLELDRRLPRASIGMNLGYDAIDGEASFTLTITPDAVGTGSSTGGLLGSR